MIILKEKRIQEKPSFAKVIVSVNNGRLKASVDFNCIDAIEDIDPYRAKRYGLDRVSPDLLMKSLVKGLTSYLKQLEWISIDDDYELVSMIKGYL